MFSFQQLYTHFIPVTTTIGYRWMNTGIIPARKNCHGDTGISCSLQLSGDLGYLLVCSCSKKYFGNERLISIFLLLPVTSIFISFFSRRTGTLSARARRLQPKTKKRLTKSYCKMNMINLFMLYLENALQDSLSQSVKSPRWPIKLQKVQKC